MPGLGPFRVAEALDDLTVIENDEATVLQAGTVVVLLHQVVVELLHVLDHDGLIGHVKGDFLQEEKLAIVGHRDPSVTDEEGGPVCQGVVGEHRDHAGLRIFERDATVLGIGPDIRDVLARVLALGGRDRTVESVEALVFGAGQDLLRHVFEGLLIDEQQRGVWVGFVLNAEQRLRQRKRVDPAVGTRITLALVLLPRAAGGVYSGNMTNSSVITKPQPSDVDIAQAHTLEPIADIAERAGIPGEALIPYGTTKAKVDVPALRTTDVWDKPLGRTVLVTAMSPTPAGEGKSTTLIGLADALRTAGQNTIVAIREPSQGPVMGIKGGAAGGGYAQIVPMEDINLHLTGDMHALTAANNTLAALIDNHIQQGNELGIDPRRVTWRRCMDVNDRSLRSIVTGLGGPAHGTPREAGFDITAASEMMAILCLATDLADLKAKLANIVIGQTYSGGPVTVGDLQVEGALTALLRDALNPNLVQTLGGTPALIHGGPFANIAHGCNSLIATQTARRLGDIVVTEAGFGSDLGAEKFFDIKAREGSIDVDAAVVVATIRSLKYNGGVAKEDLNSENLAALDEGLKNLERHVKNMEKFGTTPVVALNLFTSDTDVEREHVAEWAEKLGVRLAESTVWAEGGAGATELAQQVLEVIESGETPQASSQQLYDPAEGLAESIKTIATRIYGASGVEFSTKAKKDLQFLAEHGWDKLPVCISKTQYSFSDDPAELGAPEGHVLHVRELAPRLGAGFVVALTGQVMTMPGLPKRPAAEQIDAAEDGTITGLF